MRSPLHDGAVTRNERSALQNEFHEVERHGTDDGAGGNGGKRLACVQGTPIKILRTRGFFARIALCRHAVLVCPTHTGRTEPGSAGATD
jgi:hypothetical protein